MTFGMPGGFDAPRELMGDAELCVAYYEQPELIHDMLADVRRHGRAVLDRVSKVVQIDELSVHEDMAGKSGPLAGPKQIEEFIGPYYRRVWDMLQEQGGAAVHAGLRRRHEPGDRGLPRRRPQLHAPDRAGGGNDIVALMHRFRPRLAFQGGIDKHVLAEGRGRDRGRAGADHSADGREPAAAILALDHRIPNGTPLADYRFYVKKVWEILARECARAGLALDVPESVGL